MERAVRRIAVLLALTAMLVPGQGSALGANLLPNASFEDSVVEPPPPVPPYTNPQPLLPEGWAFEGAAGLFDHSQNGSRSGRRMAAISIPASTKREVCLQQTGCIPNLAHAVTDTAYPVYSVTPHWRTALPVRLPAGKTSFTMSAYVQLSIVTEGEGAVSRVRWLNANGVPVGDTTAGPSRRQRSVDPADWGAVGKWELMTKTVTAPSGAVSAVVMFGHSDDLWIGQVRFDDVLFAAN